MPKKIEYDADSLFDSLISEGISSFQGGGNISVIEFAEDILFNGEYQLYPTQRALLKAYYGEPLEEDEAAILQEWCVDNRTTWIEDRHYSNLVLESGRRGSKSTICSIISLYELYKLISLPSPAQHYGLLPNSPIAIFVISQSLDQVKETLFAAIKGYAEGSQYFKGLVKSGKIEILSTEIRCSEKNVGIYAKHTNSKSLVGYSIKCLILDEAARFEIDEFGHSKADEIWQNVGRATRTFGKEGRKVAISSAWEPGDYIEILYGVAERDTSTIGFRLKTWDLNLNPNLSETSLKSSEDYIKDPLLAALEYEGIRNSKQGSFFIPDHVKNSFTGTSILDAREIKIDIKNAEGDLRHYVGVEIDRLVAVNSGHSFAHCDYGVKKDSAAFAVVRPFQREDGKWVIQVDGILRWKPFLDRDKNNKGIRRVVSFLNAENKIIQVCKARRVMLMSFDSFQSEHTIQKLHTQGITTKEMKTSTQMQLTYYSITKTLMSQGLLILPKDSIWSSALEGELLGIFQIPSTGKIDHSKAGKDLCDALTNSVYNCYLHMAKSGLMSAMAGGIATIGSETQKKLDRYYNSQEIQKREAVKKLQTLKSRSL